MIPTPNSSPPTSMVHEQNFTCTPISSPKDNHFHSRSFAISSQPFSLPYCFLLRFKKSYEGRNARKQGQKYYWVFSHPNGCPVSFKKFRFFIAVNQKILPDCFSLCKQTYQLMLCVQISETLASFSSMMDEEQQTEEWQVFQHSSKTLQNNFAEFHKFLMKIGFISTSDKGCRKFLLTRQIVMARIQLSKILQNDKAKALNCEQGKFQKVKPEERFSEQTRDSYGRGSVESLRNQLQLERGSTNSVKSENRLSLINSAVKRVKRIKIQNRKELQQEFSGGYFTVKNYQATIFEDFKRDQALTKKDEMIERSSPKMIAVKRLRKQFEGNIRYANKVKHEMEIVKQIKNKTYICTYYESEQGVCLSDASGRGSESAIDEELNQLCLKEQERNNKCSLFQNSIVMESLFISLKEIQDRSKFLNQFQVIVQLLQAVISLHKSGIVHRDIKPANIMFNELGHLKLIDFSQSIECWRQFSDNAQNNLNIGLTLPYSPLECSSHCASGYSNLKIDNWSVGLVISELILGKSPLCYSKSLSSIIKSGWSSDEFQFCFNLRINSYHDTLLLPIKVLALRLMSVDQQKRLNLEQMQVLISFYQKYICTS